MDAEHIVAISIVGTLALFVVLPAMTFHYITKWRNQKTLMPNDEQMLEDLWRSAKAMERRIDTLERLISDVDEKSAQASPRTRPHPDDY